MGRSKKTPFPPWQSEANNGVERNYPRLANTMLKSPAYRTLSDKAKVIHTDMLWIAGGGREFVYPRSRYKDICAPATFARVRDELILHGFIEITEHNVTLRKPDVYIFSERWKRFRPP
ncbi:MAG: hypothetical protein LUE16_04630 [Lachnospiraceae bacterium]|nr:hypothetical protein [Lachnospiraceae bacterium]